MRLNTIQALRLFAALNVAIFHFISLAGLYLYLGTAFRTLEIFFVLSGFILFIAHKKDFGNSNKLKNYIYRRLSRLYPAVFIVTTLSILIYSCGFGHTEKMTMENIVTSLLLLPHIGLPLVNVTWSLKYEIVFYAVCALAICQKTLGIITFAGWQLTTIVIVLLGLHYPKTLANFYFQPRVIEFGLGVFTALIYMNDRIKIPPFLGWILITGSVVGFYTLPISENSGLVYPIVFGGLSSILIFCLARLEQYRKINISSPIVFLGNASYSIFLIHFSVLSILLGVMKKYSFATTPFSSILVISASGLAGCLFHFFVDDPLQNYLKKFNATVKHDLPNQPESGGGKIHARRDQPSAQLPSAFP